MQRRKLEFEEKLRSHLELTEAEKQQYELDKKVYELAKKQSALASLDDLQTGYKMPDQIETEDGRLDLKKKEKILNQRYVDVSKNMPNEHELWEQSQIQRAQAHYRTANEQEEAQAKKQYDLIIENQIEFVRTDLLAEIKLKENHLKAINKRSKHGAGVGGGE